MIKKLLVMFGLGIGMSIAGSVFVQTHAYACDVSSGGVCGYFNGGGESAWCNVLPDTSIRWGGYNRSWRWTTNYPSYCWLNTSRNFGQSRLVGVTNSTSFINDMYAYLYESSGTSDFVRNSNVGAAFLIDDMLGIDRNNGNSGAGVNDARANWGTWVSRVNSLAINQCNVSWQANCPGMSFGINWGYVPQYFCNGGMRSTVTSGYDPWAHDTPSYETQGNCDHDWNASVPEIVLFWTDSSGVLRSFRIGSQCGNVQESGTTLPPPNHPPMGTISVKCIDPNTGLQSAHITFSDPDLATTAEFTVAGQLYGPYGASPSDISLLLPPTTDAYNKQTVTLLVKDSGPLGDQAYHTILPTVQTDSPCVNFGCTGAVTTPTVLDPYTSYSLTLGVKVSVGQSPPNPTIDIQSIVTPGGSTYYTHGQIAAVDNAGVVGATFSGIPNTGGTTGQFTANWRLYSNGTLLAACPGTFNVINLPYLNVYGGDVMTGAAPAVGATCSINNAAGAYSWNQYGAGYAGAGSEYAVQALAQIDEFGSAMNPSSSSPPVGLSFANSAIAAGKVNISQGLYGGFFGDSSGAWACGTDYTKGLSPISGAAATTQIANIPPTPGDAQINDGQQLRIYATGDVYISRNIAYQPGAWPKIDQIPFFELVVTGGNIYIDSSVTQLDGIYIAEPSGAAGGQIIDCATNAGGILKQVDPTVNGFYSTCNKQLVINGAFVAKHVLFGRTNGSLGQATAGDSLGSNHDAEVFNYTPEIWLPRNAATPSDTYDAITALPPVL